MMLWSPIYYLEKATVGFTMRLGKGCGYRQANNVDIKNITVY